jgi:hypothetical protein
MAEQQNQPDNALSAGSPQIQALVRRLGWKHETAIRRIQSALPVPVEQSMYFDITIHFRVGVRPETFARLLRYFNNGQELSDMDLQDRVQGQNLFSNKVAQVAELIFQALSLREEIEDMGFSASLETMSRLVVAYGDETQDIVDLVADNVWEIARGLKIRPSSQSKIMNVILKAIAYHAAETEGQSGMPNPVSAEEIVALLSSLRRSEGWASDDDDAEDIHFFNSRDDRSSKAWSPEPPPQEPDEDDES